MSYWCLQRKQINYSFLNRISRVSFVILYDFSKFREKKKPTLCPRVPLCIWALLQKALHKHVLTWSLAGVLTRFSVTGFVFALQVQVWETAVECCAVVLLLGLLLCLLDKVPRILLGAWETLKRGWRAQLISVAVPREWLLAPNWWRSCVFNCLLSIVATSKVNNIQSRWCILTRQFILTRCCLFCCKRLFTFESTKWSGWMVPD